MTYKTAREVLEKEYTPSAKMVLRSEIIWTEECVGNIAVLVVQTDVGHDVWNIHPLRKGWQKVYSLPSCNPEEQVIQSLQSLKRLFEKE